MSVVTDQGNLTSATTGIYSNPGSHGQFWERPTSLELINPDGSTGFQIDCGIRIRGGFSRSTSNPKHALRFFFRSEYGDGKLKFPLFGNEGADQFDKIDLRTSQNYSWAFQGDASNTFLREVLGRDLQGGLGQPYTRSRYYHLYLNGVYWGLYMTDERAEASYGETYFGGRKDDFDTLKSAGGSGGYNTEATDGTFTQGTAGAPGSDWAAQWFMARDQFASPTLNRYLQMRGLNPDGTRNPAFPVYVDVDNLADYMLCIGYTGNYDAPLSDFIGASNNWFAVRDRVRDDRGFAYFVHDGEHSLGAGGNGRERTTGSAPETGPAIGGTTTSLIPTSSTPTWRGDPRRRPERSNTACDSRIGRIERFSTTVCSRETGCKPCWSRAGRSSTRSSSPRPRAGAMRRSRIPMTNRRGTRR